MACDMFSSKDAQSLLQGKYIYFFGDSNIRALYKDLIWLLEDGRLIPNARLKCKNELSHANDVRLSNGTLHSGRNYEEIRKYNEKSYIMFEFITRLYQPDFIRTIKHLRHTPDVLVINSCLWDLTRWGSSGVEQYKRNVGETLNFLKTELPKTRIIWVTSLPPCFLSEGGFLTREIEFLRNMVPWHVLYGNKYASDLASSLNIDVLDLHYQFRFLMNYHTKDGIHWVPKAVRYATNMLLTHIALCGDYSLPNQIVLNKSALQVIPSVMANADRSKLEFNRLWNNKNKRKKKQKKQKRYGVQHESNFSQNLHHTLIDSQNQLNVVSKFSATQCNYSNNRQRSRNVNQGRIDKGSNAQKKNNLRRVLKNVNSIHPPT